MDLGRVRMSSSIFQPRPDDPLRGAFLMVLAALFFAGMSAAVKWALGGLPNTMVVFFRNAISLVVLVPWLLRHGTVALETTEPLGHLVRALGGLVAMYCFFYAIGHLPLADAVLLNYTLPLFLPLIERFWLGEPIRRQLWGPILLGFGGILIILRPGSGVFEPVALLALVAAVFAALAQVGIRRLTRTEPVARIVFYFSAIATAVAAVPLVGSWRNPSPEGWAALVVVGLLGVAGQFLLTGAYASAPAAWVGPFLYTSVVFSGLFDWLVWHTLPDALFLVGAVVVTLAAALTLKLRRTQVPLQVAAKPASELAPAAAPAPPADRG